MRWSISGGSNEHCHGCADPSPTSAVRVQNKSLRGVAGNSGDFSSPYLGERQAGRQLQAELLKQERLVPRGAGEAALADLDAALGGEDDVHHLNLSQFVEHLARLVAETGAAAPLGQGFPQHVRQEADEDRGLDPVLQLVPNRPEAQVILVNAEGRFSLGERADSGPRGRTSSRTPPPSSPLRCFAGDSSLRRVRANAVARAAWTKSAWRLLQPPGRAQP